jgi:hypothetical protein
MERGTTQRMGVQQSRPHQGVRQKQRFKNSSDCLEATLRSSGLRESALSNAIMYFIELGSQSFPLWLISDNEAEMSTLIDDAETGRSGLTLRVE